VSRVRVRFRIEGRVPVCRFRVWSYLFRIRVRERVRERVRVRVEDRICVQTVQTLILNPRGAATPS
jgi:hypothetical protein